VRSTFSRQFAAKIAQQGAVEVQGSLELGTGLDVEQEASQNLANCPNRDVNQPRGRSVLRNTLRISQFASRGTRIVVQHEVDRAGTSIPEDHATHVVFRIGCARASRHFPDTS
ncbi:MAG: hypothetical protein O2931_11685, partial [Planctomycetota bacterium]|nr:hypothetical protein [Planctomycetota bacterium]